MGNENGIVKVDPVVKTQGIIPTSVNEAWQFAKAAAASGIFGIKSAEAAFMIVARACEMGIGPATALSNMHVISGKPTLSADLQVALCKQRRDLCKYFYCVESTDQQATWETLRVGDPGPTRLTFTMEDAKKAGLLGNSMWQKYPKQMLKKRAAAFLARDTYQELVAGLYSPEEMEEVAAQQPPQQVHIEVTEPMPAQDPEPPRPTPSQASLIERISKSKSKELARLASEVEPGTPAHVAFVAKWASIVEMCTTEQILKHIVPLLTELPAELHGPEMLWQGVKAALKAKGIPTEEEAKDASESPAESVGAE